jgi:hypothetical protein
MSLLSLPVPVFRNKAASNDIVCMAMLSEMQYVLGTIQFKKTIEKAAMSIHLL